MQSAKSAVKTVIKLNVLCKQVFFGNNNSLLFAPCTFVSGLVHSFTLGSDWAKISFSFSSHAFSVGSNLHRWYWEWVIVQIRKYSHPFYPFAITKRKADYSLFFLRHFCSQCLSIWVRAQVYAVYVSRAIMFWCAVYYSLPVPSFQKQTK